MKRSTQTSKDNRRRMPGEAISSRENRSFVIYGRSGTGKTTLAATFPTPILLLDINDKGTESVGDVKGIELRRLSSFEEFEDMYWWLKDNPDEFKTVVIDTVSQLQSMVVQEIGGDSKQRRGKRAGDWGSMTKKDWGDVSGILKEWLVNYRDLTDDGMEIVFIAQDRTFSGGDDEENDDQLTPEVGPALSPSVAKTLNASASLVVRTFLKSKVRVKEVKGKKKRYQTIEYCLGMGPSPIYTQKVRKPRSVQTPDYITDPTYDDIIAIIRGS